MYASGLCRRASVWALCALALGLTGAPAAAAKSVSPAWTISPSPNDGTLKAVSCVSRTFCKAVGFNSLNGAQTSIESWNGTSWRISASPHSGTLNAVSCVSASFCTAVGYYLNGSSVERTLIESWNGSKWKVSTSANDGTSNNLLNGVSCVSKTSCKAVGTYSNVSLGFQTLAESWNGTKWSIVPSASPGLGIGSNELLSVSCVSATSCQAVGDAYYSGQTYETLIESWKSGAWRRVASPNPNNGSNIDYLYGVSCVSAISCKAVGFYDDDASVGRSLAESWNGTTWKVSKSPNHGTGHNYLNGVSCASKTSCKAVGYYQPGGSYRTLIESWNGASWTLSASPTVTDGVLNGVSCISGTWCKAVGGGTRGGVLGATLIESYGAA